MKTLWMSFKFGHTEQPGCYLNAHVRTYLPLAIQTRPPIMIITSADIFVNMNTFCTRVVNFTS